MQRFSAFKTLAALRAFFVPERGALVPRPYAVVAGLGILVGVLLALSEPGTRVEWSLYDLYARRASAGTPPAPGIVIVAIDEPSFAEIGLPWPWPRSLHGALIDRLVEGGARTIALDILFDVPASDPDEDASLAQAIARAGNVILASDQAVVEDRGYGLTQWTDPIPPFSSAAAATGVIRIPYDGDGVLRRAWLSIADRPSFALAVASRDPAFSTRQISDAGRRLARLVRFNGEPRRGVVTVSYYQALDPASLPADMFKNQHVLVGRSLAAAPIDEQADYFTTPVSPRMAGVEIHATILDALLRDRFMADPFERWSAWLGITVIAGGLAAAGLYRRGPFVSALIAASSVGALLGLGNAAFNAGIRVPVMAPSLVVIAVYAVTAAYRFSLLARERRMIKRAFQHYVAPAIVEQMLADPSRLKLGGTEYEVTVLFSDLEGFTTLSEHLGAAELSAHLGGYFKEMLDVLLLQRGTLDKLIGDSIMMYFGCPIPDDRHAVQACRGALAMQQRMIALNTKWDAKRLPQLRTRIGINTGRAVAGNMGTDTIFNYTILGDSVNLASRLEAVNKEYGTLTIVGEDTWKRVHEEFETRELDWIRVKGKTRPVAIYELVAEKGTLPPRRREVFEHFAEGLARYREGRWTAAREAFERALAADPADGPSRTFEARCADYAERPPDAWDGVYVMKTK